jgi:hypothetical protein
VASRSFSVRVRQFPANFRARARDKDQRELCDRPHGLASVVVRIQRALARRACARPSEQELVQVLLRRLLVGVPWVGRHVPDSVIYRVA